MHNDQEAHCERDTDLTRIKLLEAIARTVLLTARYNGETLTLAPHALFARRGDLFVSALNLSKKRRTGEEMHLGSFKVAGLAGIELTGERFQVLPAFTPSFSNADDELILAAT